MSDEQAQPQRPKGGIPRDPKSLTTLIFTGKVLSVAAQSVSESVDSFSGWLLAGFGAFLALLLANIDKLRGFIEISALRHAARFYFAAAILGVFAKLLGLMVTSATKGKSGASELTPDAGDIDLDLYLETAQRAFFPHARWFLKRLVARALEQGDLTYIDRMWMKCAQVQSLIVMVEAVLVLIAGGMIVFSI
jgi:hypothetical protein